ncbi:MFS general substrate transporter, partial [Polychaeton citri CBS 116435]
MSTYIAQDGIRHDEKQADSAHISDDSCHTTQPVNTFHTVPEHLHPNRPMRWPSWLRHFCLFQIALNGSMVGFTGAITIPAQQALAKRFSTSLQEASYVTSSHVLLLGLGPLLWSPLTNRFGRRICLTLGMLISFASNLGSAYAESYGALIAARVIQGIGISTGASMGAAVVVELFAPEHRATKLNVWSVMVTAGPAIGALIGGFLVEAMGWRWTFFLSAIINGAEAVLYALTFPETHWADSRPIPLRERFGFYMNREAKLSVMDFFRPVLFLQNPAMVLMILLYGCSFGFISVGLSITLPQVFIPVYNFSPSATGLVFISYIIGALLGGQVGGRMSDMIMNRHARQRKMKGMEPRYEHRFVAVLPGYILSIVGLVIFGVTLEAATHWSGPVVAFGIAQAGLQVVMNVVNTYCIDCYQTHALDVTVYLNTLRQIIGFSAGFWIPPLERSCGFGLGIGILAIVL